MGTILLGVNVFIFHVPQRAIQLRKWILDLFYPTLSADNHLYPNRTFGEDEVLSRSIPSINGLLPV